MEPLEFDRGLFRGAQPKTRADFERLASLGIKTMLDLRTYPFDWGGDRRFWQLTWARLGGMEVVSAPLSAIVPPSFERLTVILGMLRGTRLEHPVFIHCRDGVDRTGMVCAAYKARFLGQSYEAVVADMLADGFHRFRYWWWLPSLKAAIKRPMLLDGRPKP